MNTTTRQRPHGWRFLHPSGGGPRPRGFNSIVRTMLGLAVIACPASLMLSIPSTGRAQTPSATDVLIVFDTTGSMSGALTEAKAQAGEVMRPHRRGSGSANSRPSDCDHATEDD